MSELRRSRARVRVGFVCGVCALVVALLAASGSAGARVRLSESLLSQNTLSQNSEQVAYSAGLGFNRMMEADVAPARHLAGSPATCVARSRALGSSRVAYAALVRRVAVIRKAPLGSSPEVGRFGRLNQNGFRSVLAVIGRHSSSHCTTDWYRVGLPVLPNGTTGWVRAWAVQPYRVRSRVAVDLSQRRLRLYRDGKLALQTTIAVGAPATPTPLGRYFVNERYVLPDASGPFGPNALGISAHSDVLSHVWVEDGPIGIHGTNEPWSIGRAASHGCIRVPNSVMPRLFRLAPAGTPVVVSS
jgi:lipoprotein-anchoring transpeptidase ErfK/SrfK